METPLFHVQFQSTSPTRAFFIDIHLSLDEIESMKTGKTVLLQPSAFSHWPPLSLSFEERQSKRENELKKISHSPFESPLERSLSLSTPRPCISPIIRLVLPISKSKCLWCLEIRIVRTVRQGPSKKRASIRSSLKTGGSLGSHSVLSIPLHFIHAIRSS